jgi:uncharacterized membrane protein
VTLDVWLLPIVLWFYFHLTSVAPSDANPMSATLPRRVASFGTVMRTCVCITPLIAWRKGLPLSTNVFACSFALTTLIGPLLLPTREPGAAESRRSFWLFATKWALSELDRAGKTTVVAALVWFISLLPAFYDGRGQALLSEFAFVTRVPNSLVLPFWFYISALLVLLIKVGMLLAVPVTARWHSMRPIVGWLVGVVALIYFYNLSALVPLTHENWEAPVGGFFAAVVFKFYTAWNLAKYDEMEEDSGLY